MRSVLLLLICHLALLQFGQIEVKGPWTFEVGASSNNFFADTASLNLRYISPRFKWSEEWNEDEEKYPDKYRNTRMMVEMMYRPLKKVITLGFIVQSRLIGTKRFSLNMYGGVKFFIFPGKDFVQIPYLKGGREIWYMTAGLIFQYNLGVIAPFADLGGDGIVTIGTEVNLHKIHRKTKKRYKLRKGHGNLLIPKE
ncbi:MAG: hypothetical protein JNJ41_18410 [Bacteroidia bacterium]|nr:hypothetical protein [Bacteroidia bacterium]